MLRRHPVITGTGIICAAGSGVASVWQSIRAGTSGLRRLTLFPTQRYANHFVGEVEEDVDALAGHVRGSRSDKLAWIAAREALAGAGFAAGLNGISPVRVGVMLGATVGGMLGSERFLTALLRKQKRRFGPLRFHECAGAADLCAQQIGARGPVATLATACSAGAMAILAAAELIEQGEADVMLAGAGDSLSRLTLHGFGSLLLLDPDGCRPFDARRAGISLGEGAGMLVIEAEETARARGAEVLARLAGWGASCDAYHATAPHPEGRGALAAMQRALQRGSLVPEVIDFVSAHGTATPDNDAMETKALRSLFGDRVPPFSSVKRFTGHTLAASGAIKAVLAVQSLREQGVPGTPGFELADEQLGLTPVKLFREQRVQCILSNSFGFGGNNVALVLAHADGKNASAMSRAAGLRNLAESETELRDAPATGTATFHLPSQKFEVVAKAVCSRQVAFGKLAILGAGVVSAAGCSMTGIAAAFRQGGTAVSQFAVPSISATATTGVCAAGEFDAEPLLRRRKLNRIQQMVLVAARQALAELPVGTAPESTAVAIGTGLGSLNDTAGFVENLILKEERTPRPMLFTNSVHNSLAAQVAIEFNFAGLNATPVQREISFETALLQAATELVSGRAEKALAGAADELNQYQLAAGLRRGRWRDDATTKPATPLPLLPGEGAAVFALGRGDSAAKPLAYVSAIRIGRSGNTSSPALRDAEAEATWMIETLQRDGISANEVDLLLTGANGLRTVDEFYRAVAAAFSRLTGRIVPGRTYKQCCGEHPSASAFGFYAAIGLVRGEIASEQPCKTVILLTLSPTGTKGMCCVHAPNPCAHP